MKKSKTSESKSETEIALQESERKFSDTIKYLDQGYYSCMMDGEITEHNRAFNKVLGIDISKDMKGAKLPDFWLNPDERKVYLQELMTRGFIMNYLINAKTISGEKVVVMANSHLVKDERGEPVRIEGTFTDFTRMKLMEEALKESETKYRTLFENAQVGMYRSKIDGSAMLDVNKKFGEILGLTREESLGKAGRILWANSEDRDKMMKLLKEQDGNLYNYEARLLAKNGEVRDVLASIKLNPEKDSLEGTFVDITDRKEADKKIKDDEEKFRALFEKSPLGIAYNEMIFDTSGKPIDYRFLEVNEAYIKIIGLDPRGKKVTEAFPGIEKFSFDWIGTFGHVAQTGEQIYFEQFFESDNRWYDCVAFQSKKNQYAVVFQDISERKRAEEALRNSETFLNSIIDQSPVPMWISDDKGILIRINKACCSILKITEQDVIGKYNVIEDNIVREQGLLSDVRKVFDNGETVRFEIRYNTSKLEGLSLESEAEVILDTTIFPIKDYKGKVTNAVIQHMDITERKRSEEQLREASLYARNLIEASLDPLVTISSDGKIMDVNKATEEVTGDMRSKLIGSDFSDYFTEPEKAKAGYRKVLADRSVTDYPLTLRHTSGKTTDVLYNATVYHNEKGIIQGVFAAARDITVRKLAEEEIRKLNTELEDRVAKRTTQLEASNKELEAFSYSVSHDLRAPLRHVSGYVELLNKHFQSDLPEKGQHYLSSIADSVRIMGMLIDDLLQFSKTGRMEMHQSDFDMNEVVKEVIESLRIDNPDRKIDWVLGKLASVNGDEAMLRVVWMNLLSNAVKFTRTRKKARIEIGVRNENKELVFFVRDNGVGFDMQYAQKLFGVFQRLHPTEEFEGTGIGLANVHRIIMRQGGRTWAEAEPDKGAVFYFSIPIK